MRSHDDSATERPYAKLVPPDPLASQRKLDSAPRPPQTFELQSGMVQRWIKNESTKIGGAGLNSPALNFQRMTQLQMGVRYLAIEFERFSVGVLGLRDVAGFL